MPWFEDVRNEQIHSGLDPKVMIGLMAFNNFEVQEVIQQRPWTMVKVRVCFNNVAFEGVGFARQRQYTSLVAHRVRGFPWFRMILARKDRWDACTGQTEATVRALNRVSVNAWRVYRRWNRGQVVLASKWASMPAQENQ